jgi:hypothetical protein
MTTTATPQPRVKTGQYTFAEHSEGTPVLPAPMTSHEHAFVNLVGDGLSPAGEAEAARSAIADAAIAGDFGDAVLDVRSLAEDDRLVRLAVDRFVVRETDTPGSHNPDQTGWMLGRYLIELRDEDIEDSVAGLEWSE